MRQEELTKVIDTWSAAVADLAKGAPKEKQQRLTAASSDLLNAFAATATELSAASVGAILRIVEALAVRVGTLEDAPELGELEGRVIAEGIINRDLFEDLEDRMGAQEDQPAWKEEKGGS